uniref:Transmembrane protein 9 n=1 Tax=Romanomermis culicivorax TaxID=13658 RepID=A0A915HLI1_ROMCU
MTIIHSIILIVIANAICVIQAQFEDTRCRCFCPTPAAVGAVNATKRNIYIKMVSQSNCNCREVVLPELKLEPEKKYEYCARCECKFQSRNTATIKVVVFIIVVTMLSLIMYMIWLKILNRLFGRARKNSTFSGDVLSNQPFQRFENEQVDMNARPGQTLVVVILVVSVLGLLIVYLLFLLCLDPMLKNPRKDHAFYQRQTNDEDNIFVEAETVQQQSQTFPGSMDGGGQQETRLRRASEAVLGKVEQQQNRWFAKVHEQRKKIFTDHTMLN